MGHAPGADGLLLQAIKSLYSGSPSLVHIARSKSGGVRVQWPQNSISGFADDFVLLASLSNGLQLSLEWKRQGWVLAPLSLFPQSLPEKGRIPTPSQGGAAVLT